MTAPFEPYRARRRFEKEIFRGLDRVERHLDQMEKQMEAARSLVKQVRYDVLHAGDMAPGYRRWDKK